METIFNYEMPHQALEDLQKKGYDIDYNLQASFEQLSLHPNDYIIDFLYRYEGMTDPADESSIYGIRRNNGEEKGVFVAGNLSFIEGKKRDVIVQLEIVSKGQIEE